MGLPSKPVQDANIFARVAHSGLILPPQDMVVGLLHFRSCNRSEYSMMFLDHFIVHHRKPKGEGLLDRGRKGRGKEISPDWLREDLSS